MKSQIVILLVLMVFLVGCSNVKTPTGQVVKEPVCNKPYILVGTDCCLDQDDNSICDSDESKEVKEEPIQEGTVVSISFNDFGEIYCDADATNLQKHDLFDKEFKNNYVKWTGEISSISESFGKYTLQIKHCPNTFVSDILVTMKDDQKDKLLKYKEGDTITYKAKLIRLGDLLGLSATDGEVISGVVKEAKQESETTEVKQEVQSNKGYENTKNGITLTVEGYNFEKKTDTYGKLKDVSIVIYNHQGSDVISPNLLIQVVDKKDSKLTVLKKVELSEYIYTGESIHRTVEVDLGIAGIDNPKEMRINVIRYTDDIFVTVYFDTNLLKGFEIE